ncbi:MAG: SapC family protein [Ideonella sp.]|nr:SapC family protein [Ideonella sp.]MCC7459653.1 SapC family protein [Nitrospira sp.]
MIHPDLHLRPVALDREQHRLLRLRRDAVDLSRFAALNSMFVLAGEFGEACKDYPLVWVEAGTDPAGARQVAPVAVFGLARGENLCISGGAWRTRYVPLALRCYPFAMARAGEQFALCYDSAAPWFSVTEGEALFATDGAPGPLLAEVRRQLEAAEAEVERTRLSGLELLRLDLLRPMRFEGTMPGGEPLVVDGFLTLDEERFAKLTDADVLALHKTGLLALLVAHGLSLSNMHRLTDWRAQARAATQPAAAG